MYKFDVLKVRRAYRYRAARSAVYFPILGGRWSKRKNKHQAALDDLRAIWSARLTSLRAENYERLVLPKNFTYCTNCPPFGVTTKQQSHCCTMSKFCPFCYGRDYVLRPFIDLELVLFGNLRGESPPLDHNQVLVSFATKHKMTPKGKYDSAYDWTQQQKSALTELSRMIVTHGRNRERAAFNPAGGVILHRQQFRAQAWYTIRSGIFICDGRTFNEAHFAPSEQEQFSCKMWLVTKQNLQLAAAQVFAYPASMLHVNAVDLVNYLDAMKRVRMLSRFGSVRAVATAADVEG